MATNFKSVDAATAMRLIEGGAHVVDVRAHDEWAAGHIDGSDRVPAGRISKHSVGRADTVLAVCATGKQSRRAARKLVKEGYQVYHLAGGLLAWRDAGLPLRSANGSRPEVR